MGIIRETTEHDLGAHIDVVERQPGEHRQQWAMINLKMDSFNRLTPRELRQLGNWLITEGARIGKEYKSNGAPRHNTKAKQVSA